MHITVILRCLADVGQMCFLDGAFMLSGSKTTYLDVSPTVMSTISCQMHHFCLYAHRRLLPWRTARAERTLITSPSYISPRCQYTSTSPPKFGIPDSGSGESLKRASITSPIKRPFAERGILPPPTRTIRTPMWHAVP